MNTDITPFRIEISDEAIADLRERLAMARWPQQVGGDPVGVGWRHDSGVFLND